MTQYIWQDDSRLPDLESIRECPTSHFESIMDLVASGVREPFADELFERIQEITNGEKTIAALIMRQAFWFGTICDKQSCTAEQLVMDLCDELSNTEWSDDEVKLWESKAQLLGTIAFTDVFRAARKAIELSYDYVNVYRQAKVLTDVRPIFSSDASEILSAIVSHCLRISYDTTDGLKDIAIMLEDNEVRYLQKQCERALVKGRTASELLAEKSEIPTKISGI